MHQQATRWFEQRTSRSEDWPLDTLLAAKARAGVTISVVIPARDEQESVGAVVRSIRTALVEQVALVDELVVMDSMSGDATGAQAAAAGATVRHVRDVVSQLGVASGKGEALWKSLFVTRGDILVFIDADLSEWGTHFVSGLVGPLLAVPEIALVRGFYDRVADEGRSTEGGRVTELVARPLISLDWPELAAVVQPLAGEWAIRRSLFESLPVPVGYGVEFSTLVDTWQRHGLEAIAQVDLGRRAHRHQSVHDLGVMAAEILAVAQRRREPPGSTPEEVVLSQFDRVETWRERPVPTGERPPALSVAEYAEVGRLPC